MTAGGTLRWAILGTGTVSRKFVLGLRQLGDQARATVVASRSPENARNFAAAFDIPFAAPSFAEAVARSDVDAVYIATPPSEHESHAMMAIAERKAVLVEKPFALNADAARRIAEASRSASVFCMEAMWTRFLPMVTEARRVLEAGELGEVRTFHGRFMGSDVPDSSSSIFDADRGGGALMHRGVYPLSLARHLLGPITRVESVLRFGSTGVDEDCSLIVQHSNGAVTTLSASLRAPGPSDVVIGGTRGMLRLDPPIYRPFQGAIVKVQPRGGQPGAGRLDQLREAALIQRLAQAVARSGLPLHRSRRFGRFYTGNGYHYEAAEVAHGVRSGALESEIMPLAESIEVMSVIDLARSNQRGAQ